MTYLCLSIEIIPTNEKINGRTHAHACTTCIKPNSPHFRGKGQGARYEADSNPFMCITQLCVTHSITQSNSKGLHRIPVWLLYHDKYKQCNDYNITNGMESLTNRVIVEPKYPTNHIVTARKGQREKDFKNSRFSKLSSYRDILNIVFIQVWVS